MNDGGAGIRFNFPGFAPFRPISWDEWFGNFDAHDLVFMYEEQDTTLVAERAYTRWKERGGEAGHDREDWFEAEREVQCQTTGSSAPVRYRLVIMDADES